MFQHESDEPGMYWLIKVLMVDFNVFFHFAYPKKPILPQVALNIPISVCHRVRSKTENMSSPRIWKW